MIAISVVIPLLDEADNLKLLHSRLTAALEPLGRSYEIVFVDDGSTDSSPAVLQELHRIDPRVRIIEFRRNFGKTAALVAGFELARGEVIITLDADLQDDPAEIPALLDKLDSGYDLVAAWRRQRMDNMGKRRSSTLFNLVVARLTGVQVHDLNCGFKVYRREVIRSVRLYSDLHRFIPVLAASQGFRVTEKVVAHQPRHAGKTKYGYGRIFRGFTDLIMVLFITRYLRQPLRLFGWAGLFIFLGGGAINVYLATLWLIRFLGLADVPPIGTRPLLTVGVLGMMLGIQLISIGLLGEMLRYFTYRPAQEYSIRQIWEQEP
jgi:glycosyltransferase involved in cell wall biosynthesis